MKSLFFSMLTLLSINSLFAQFTMDQSLTVEEYVNEILLGSGVVATNISYSGDPLQLGYMDTDEPGNFPMSGGLVLHTGDAMECIIGGTPAFITGGMGSDQDLLDIANSVPPLIGQSFTVQDTNDECILEFDFIATGDSINFNYSFGSNEWTTYINSQYNDVFAFFLSGPGITGPYDSPAGFPDGAINIAGVPDSDPNLPVTISSVHNGNPDGSDCFNCEYYNFNNPAEDVQINAYTDLFTATSEVICGETYHIKLAIADGSDGALSSMVVLEEGSFTSNSVVQVDLSIDVGGPEANTIYEDCGVAEISFTRPIETILEIEEMVFIEYGGTATEGVDFNNLPDTVIFEAFVETVSFEIDAFIDGLPEGIESVQMEILNLAACSGGGLTSYFEFFIGDVPDPLVVEGYDQTICNGNVTTIEPIISGGYGNFNYDWSNSEDTETIEVSPIVSQSYNLIVSDTCGMPSDDADFLVDVLIVDPLEVEIDQGDFSIDCGASLALTATALGGDGLYTNWSWYTETGQNLWGWQNSVTYGSWSGAEQVFVSVEDGCGLVAIDSAEVSMDVPEMTLNGADFTALCNETFTVDPMVEGGQGPLNYSWTIDGVFNWYIWEETYATSSQEDMLFSINVTDACGQSEIVDIEVSIDTPEIFINMPDPVSGNCTDEYTFTPELTGGSPSFDYEWSANGVSIGNSFSVDYGSEESVTLNLNVEDICGQTASGSVDITVVNPPIIIEPLVDIESTCLEENLIESLVSGGSGNLSYAWNTNGNTIGTSEDITWQSYTSSIIELVVSDECNESAIEDLNYEIINTPLEIETSEDFEICEGDEIDIFASAIGGEGFIFYNWNELPGSQTNHSVSPSESITYEVMATDQCNQQVQGTINVLVQQFDLSISNLYLSSNTVQYESNIFPEDQDFGVQYLWDFGDNTFSDEANPLHVYEGNNDLSGSLLIETALGCKDSVNFDYSPPVNVFVPNSFTPDNDGLNDIFKVEGDGIEDFEIFIFNRWGETVYHSTDIYDGWKGDTDKNSEYYAQNDTYSYLIKLKGYNTEIFEKTGFINLIR